MTRLFGRNNYHALKFVNFFAMLIAPFFNTHLSVIDGGEGTAGEQTMKEKENSLVADIAKKINEKYEERLKGLVTEDKLNTYMDELRKSISDSGKMTEIVETKFNTIENIIKSQSIEIAKMQNSNKPEVKEPVLSKDQRVKAMIANFLTSSAAQDFIRSPRGTSIEMSEKELKDLAEKGAVDVGNKTIEKVVDIAADYTGGIIGITSQSGKVIDTPNREVNVRDILSVTQTDQPNILGQEIYSWADEYTGSTDVLAENATALEGSFKVKENTWSVKRIAAFYDLSNRVLRSNGTKWLVNKLQNVLPKKLKFVEDRELLYGDGSGDHVTGLYVNATALDFGGNTYVATDFASIATWNSGADTLVTFAAAHNLRNGDSLTIANATAGAAATAYNKEHTSVIVVSATQVIIDAGYVADPNVAANWTGTSANPFANAIDNAQQYDVLLATYGNATYKDRMINAFLLNPVDVAKIEMLKGTDARYVGIGRDANGILRVNSIPVIETTAVAAGKFFAGIFDADILELAEFTQLRVYMMADVDYQKLNKTAIFVEEEIIFPIFEPKAIFYGDFVTAMAALETP